jgi:predicted  nucleic acid-binding Zn-ribbon protein
MEIPALADLLDLQAVDLEIDRLLERRQALPELAQYRAANQARLLAEAEHAELADRLRKVELDLDKAEGELEILETRLSESETRLYAGGMSARETEHKRLEVRSLQGQQEAMEEKVLGLLDAREQLQQQTSAAKQVVDGHKATEQTLERSIASAWKEIDLEIGRKEARKSEMVPAIPNELLERYEKLRRTKEGVAVGRLDNNQCGGCHLTLSPTEQAEAAQSDPPLCVHCRRILVL